MEVSEAAAQKKGFQKLRQEKIRQSAEQHRLLRADCPGCGAELVFAEGEAMSVCAFCGRTLVRKEYLHSAGMPEMIIPFRITRDEAAACLEEWCRQNSGKSEAKHLLEKAGELQGFYLPYELVRGPVSCRVSRMDASAVYGCRGHVDNVFVNCSRQLDNLLLDAMEPFELADLKEFDFAYAAGQGIKMRDISDKELEGRVREEVSANYSPVVQDTLETKAVEVDTDASSVLRLPVLLPVYYIRSGEVLAAVNGQTGKVSVRAEKDSHYYFIPWWLKAILATAVITGAAYGAFRLFGMGSEESLLVAGVLAAFAIIVTLCAYSDTVRTGFKVAARRRIFTSSGGPLRRKGLELVRDAHELARDIMPPAFFEVLDGKPQHVQLVFSSLPRVLMTAFIAMAVLFLPVIIALFLNGFDFARLELGGSAVWFCIMVPVIPIAVLKFAVIELYERPWIYVIAEDGSKRRWRRKVSLPPLRSAALGFLRLLIVPPACLGIWFGIACFFTMCWLTAFGFD